MKNVIIAMLTIGFAYSTLGYGYQNSWRNAYRAKVKAAKSTLENVPFGNEIQNIPSTSERWVFITITHDGNGNVTVDAESTTQIFNDMAGAMNVLDAQNDILKRNGWVLVHESPIHTTFYKDGMVCNSMVLPVRDAISWR